MRDAILVGLLIAVVWVASGRGCPSPMAPDRPCTNRVFGPDGTYFRWTDGRTDHCDRISIVGEDLPDDWHIGTVPEHVIEEHREYKRRRSVEAWARGVAPSGR